MARLLADENFPLPVVEELRRLGHDVVTLQETGWAGRALSDDAVLRLARAWSRAVLTLDRRDFIRLHEESADHAGIVVCTFDPDFAGQAGRLHAVISGLPALAREIIRVNRPSR